MPGPESLNDNPMNELVSAIRESFATHPDRMLPDTSIEHLRSIFTKLPVVDQKNAIRFLCELDLPIHNHTHLLMQFASEVEWENEATWSLIQQAFEWGKSSDPILYKVRDALGELS